MALNETQLAEIEDRANGASETLSDAVATRQYASWVCHHDIPDLIEALKEAYNADGGGGELGFHLRKVLMPRILAQPMSDESRELVEFAEGVRIHGCTVSSVANEERVFVDVRLVVDHGV